MNILFVCKHNSFRSKVAEAIFNKNYKGSKHKAISRGLIPSPKIYPNTKKIIKSLGYIISGTPKSVLYKEVIDSDMIIIVADNVPPVLFNNTKKHGKKIIVWKVKDTDSKNTKEIINITKDIERRVKNLIYKLK